MNAPVLRDKNTPQTSKPRRPPHRWRRHVTPWRITLLCCVLFFFAVKALIPHLTYSFPLGSKQATELALLHARVDPLRRFTEAYPVNIWVYPENKQWAVAVQSTDPKKGNVPGGHYLIVLIDPMNGDALTIDEGETPVPPIAAVAAEVEHELTNDETITRQQAANRALLHAQNDKTGLFADARVTDIEFQHNEWVVFVQAGQDFQVLSVNGITGVVTVIESSADAASGTAP